MEERHSGKSFRKRPVLFPDRDEAGLLTAAEGRQEAITNWYAQHV